MGKYKYANMLSNLRLLVQLSASKGSSLATKKIVRYVNIGVLFCVTFAVIDL